MKKLLLAITLIVLLPSILFGIIYLNGKEWDLKPFTGNVAEQVNTQRALYDLAPLKEMDHLDIVAKAKCDDMVNQKYYAHENPQGYMTWQLYRFDYTVAGENLATGYDASDVVQRWIASPEHKKNIVNPAFNEVGYAICETEQYYYVVQILKG